jgi:hypothetical protein
MAAWRHFRMSPPYLMEVFVRSKAAWSGGAVIIAVGIVEHATGRSLPTFWYTVALLVAVIGAQFWHGLMQFEKMQPKIRTGPVLQHFWGLDEGRGSTGTGYYFDVFNDGASESMECAQAQLVEMQPDVIGILPVALHARHKDYFTTETFISAGSSQGFDLVTGPDHGERAQRTVIIPYVLDGDRGKSLGSPIPSDGRYRLRVRISAKNCAPRDVGFEIWVEDNFLRCVPLET